MYWKFFRLLGILILISSCAKRVQKDQTEFSVEQVELSKINPLAQFAIPPDTSEMFELFSSFPLKPAEQKTSIPKENIPRPLFYYVQVGLTDSYEEILALKAQVINLFPNEKVTIEYDSPFYRILIGPFSTQSEANEIFAILERKNFSSIRIRTETTKYKR